MLKKNSSLLIVFAAFCLTMFFCPPADAEETLSFDGLIQPREIIDFSSQVPGIIAEIPVERGDWVKKGQILARLKADSEEVAVKAAHARVEFIKRKMERNELLIQKHLVSTHDQDELQTEIELGKLAVLEAEVKLAIKTIRSTVDGVVVRRMGAPGEYVGEEPFLTVAKINPLSVEIIVPDIYYSKIKEGDPATVSVQLPREKSLQAKVVIVDDVLDSASSTFGVRLELPNPDLTIPAGIKCGVTFGGK